MVYDHELSEIRFEGMTNDTSGNYTFEITLEDSMAKSSHYEVTFEILPYTEELEQISDLLTKNEDEKIEEDFLSGEECSEIC